MQSRGVTPIPTQILAQSPGPIALMTSIKTDQGTDLDVFLSNGNNLRGGIDHDGVVITHGDQTLCALPHARLTPVPHPEDGPGFSLADADAHVSLGLSTPLGCKTPPRLWVQDDAHGIQGFRSTWSDNDPGEGPVDATFYADQYSMSAGQPPQAQIPYNHQDTTTIVDRVGDIAVHLHSNMDWVILNATLDGAKLSVPNPRIAVDPTQPPMLNVALPFDPGIITSAF